MSGPALFLDRDGLLDHLVYYESTGEWEGPRRPADLRLIEDSYPLLRQAAAGGWLLFVITNQPSYAKGKTSMEDQQAVHQLVMAALSRAGVPVTKSYLCMHHPEAVLEEYRVRCECRKPGALFLQQAAREFDLLLPESWMIGDQDTDVLAARAAGCRAALVEYPHSADKRRKAEPDLSAATLEECLRLILHVHV